MDLVVRSRATMPARNADGFGLISKRQDAPGALACARRSACGCPKGDHYILLDMADALCEAKWADQGNSAKCISCFGLVDV